MHRDSFALKTEQTEWINKYRTIVYELIKETPPDGSQFLDTVEKILQVSLILIGLKFLILKA